MCFCWEERSRMPKYKTVWMNIKYMHRTFQIWCRSSIVRFLQWFFLEWLKDLPLIRSHGSTTNTVFPMQNLSLGWFPSWQGLRSSTSARNIKEITISLTLQLRVPIIYSTSETLTRSPVKNRSCVSSPLWTQPATLCFHDPEQLSGWKFQKEILWCVEKNSSLGFLDTFFFSSTSRPLLGAHPSTAPFAGCPCTPLQRHGSPWSPMF